MSKKDLLPIKYTKSIFAASQKKEEDGKGKVKEVPKAKPYVFKKEGEDEKERSLNITPSAEITFDKRIKTKKGDITISARKPLTDKSSDISASYSGKKFNVSAGLNRREDVGYEYQGGDEEIVEPQVDSSEEGDEEELKGGSSKRTSSNANSENTREYREPKLVPVKKMINNVRLSGSYNFPNESQVAFSKDKEGNTITYTSPGGFSISKRSGANKGVDVDIPLKKGGFISTSINPSDVDATYISKGGNRYNASYDKENKRFQVGARINIGKKKR